MRSSSARVPPGLVAIWIVGACLLAPAEVRAQAPAPTPAPAVAPTAKGVPSAAADKARLDDIIAGLTANAALWREDKNVAAGPEIALKSFTFDPNTVPLLVDVLSRGKTDPNSLYVAGRLLRQLSFATTNVVRTALPAAKALSAKAKKGYQTMPQLTEAQLKALKKPTDSSPKAQEALDKRRAEKVEKERAIAKQNEAIYAVEKRCCQLMLQAADPEEDKIITATLIEAQKQRSDVFLSLLEALGSDARLMSEERAKLIYDTLRPEAIDIKMDPKHGYANPGKATVREDNQSTFEVRSEYPGIVMMKVMNRIATAAKSPALKVPTEKEIAKYQADRTSKTPPKKDRTRGRE